MATQFAPLPRLEIHTERTSPLAVRPSWRGLIHRATVVAFVPLSVWLVVLASTTSARAATIVYGLGVTAMLGVSAWYHSGRLGPRAMARMKRIDHSTILLAIAGSYTAVAVLALDGDVATRLLTFIWVAALVGMGIRLAWIHAPYPVVAAVYVVVGWGALFEWNALLKALSVTQLILLIGGGLLYTLGAAVYAAHRPNLWPATFGYHEVFHSLVAAGVASHYLVIASLVLQG